MTFPERKIITYILTAMVGVWLTGCTNLQDNNAVALKTATFEVFFDVDRSNIGEATAKTLHEVADNVKQNNDTSISLSVDANSAGSDAHNQALSVQRAEAVKAELVKDGVSADKIFTVNTGTANPLIPTADGVRAPQNRRTEIILR